MHGMDMRDHMDDDPVIGMLQFDQLEWQRSSLDRAEDGDETGQAWNLRGWLGRVDNRLWLRSEGERLDGRTEHGDVELLWGHATGPWWDAMLGAPTAIAALYGMYYPNVPARHAPLGYAVVVATMSMICIALFIRFKRLRWL